MQPWSEYPVCVSPARRPGVRRSPVWASINNEGLLNQKMELLVDMEAFGCAICECARADAYESMAWMRTYASLSITKVNIQQGGGM